MSYNQGGPYRPNFPAYASHQRFTSDGTPLYDHPVQHPPHPRPPPPHQAPFWRGPPLTYEGHDSRPQDARFGGAYARHDPPPPPQGPPPPNQHWQARIPQLHHSGRQQYEPSGRRSRSPDYQAGPSSVPYQRQPFRDRPPSYKNDRPLRPPPPTGGPRHPPSPRSDYNGPRHPKIKRRTEPRDEYLATSLQPSTRLNSLSEKKLILLDLNGSLVFRAHKQNSDLFRRRPFVTTFIEYLRQRWEVGVWSSAQPHSVEKMVRSIGLKAKKVVPPAKAEGTDDTTEPVEVVEEVLEGEPKEGESDNSLTLKVLWARDTFGLTKYEYNQKTETIKDLDSIWKHLNEEEEKSSSASYSALNTLLLDDSYTKTSCQPFNHLPIPDFGQSLAFDSARAYRAALAFKKHGDNMSAELAEELGAYLIDRSLLGVVGILERASAETNVASWIREGGLVPDLSDANGWWNETSPDSIPFPGGSKPSGKKMKKSKLRSMLSSTDLSSLIFPPNPDPADSQPTQAQLLPTANPPIPWYSSPAHLSFWTQQGVDALLEMGIELDFSMTIDFLPPTKEEVEVNRAKRQAALEKEQAEASVAAKKEGVLPEVQV